MENLNLNFDFLQEYADALKMKQAKEKLHLPDAKAKDYEHDRYLVTNLEDLHETLERYGVAIIDDVLDEKECQTMERGFWEYLGRISGEWENPITRSNPKSWSGLTKLFPQHSMLLQHFGIGHAQFIWDLRQNEKILEVYSELWGVSPEELLVSFDGAAFHMPPEVTKKGGFHNYWFHSDQNSKRSKFECIQSWVTALDVNPGDATLTILEGSHKHHGELKKKFKISGSGDWCPLKTQEQLDFFVKTKKCPRRCITCPAGSMVLWDSRTMHAGQESLAWRKEQNFRCVAYLCYTPRCLATEKDLEKKRKYFEEMRMTSHWPHKIRVFGIKPNTRGNPLPTISPISEPELTPLGYSLAGFEIFD